MEGPEVTISAWFDGACSKNPGGRGSFGVVIKREGAILHEFAGHIGERPDMTNNVAEYAALRYLLDWVEAYKITEPVCIYGDSKLVISQCFGRWKIKKGAYAEIARKVQAQAKNLKNVKGFWVPRSQNMKADALSKLPQSMAAPVDTTNK